MKSLHKFTLTAMFLALGLVLPFFTGQIPQIGKMLLPMHYPVFLCALICGWQYGLALGLLLPILRSFLFSMPALYPTALAMSFELAAYGWIAGYCYEHSKEQSLISVYRSLILAMIAGRIVWGIAQVGLLGLQGNVFGWQAFLAGALFNAVPGIIGLLIVVPSVMVALDKSGLVHFRKQ